MFQNLKIEIEGPIGRLTLTRGDKLNPLGVGTLEEIALAARYFDEEQAKVVIVTGEGRAFSAGADLDSFSRKSDKSTREVAEIGRRMAEAVEAMEAITIAKIGSGGGGLVLAAACDLRLATAETRFSIPEVDLGIPLAWGGIPRLVREIGPALTKELVLTCRPFDAEEAKASGFLNRIVTAASLDDEDEALAASLAKKARHALSSTKWHVNAVTDQMVGIDGAGRTPTGS